MKLGSFSGGFSLCIFEFAQTWNSKQNSRNAKYWVKKNYSKPLGIKITNFHSVFHYTLLFCKESADGMRVSQECYPIKNSTFSISCPGVNERGAWLNGCGMWQNLLQFSVYPFTLSTFISKPMPKPADRAVFCWIGTEKWHLASISHDAAMRLLPRWKRSNHCSSLMVRLHHGGLPVSSVFCLISMAKWFQV